jgi:hypothetical protein
MKKFFDYILQGSEATEKNAIDAAIGLDWQEVETKIDTYPHLSFVCERNGVGVWYNYGCDSYQFSDESEEFIPWGEHNRLEIQLSDDHKHLRMRDKDTGSVSVYVAVWQKPYSEVMYPYFDNPFGMGCYCVYEFKKVNESAPEFGHPEDKPFTRHGVYSWANVCGCEVEISECGSMGRLRIENRVTEWYEIEHIEDEDGEESVPTIDPDGHNVPLNQVIKVS